MFMRILIVVTFSILSMSSFAGEKLIYVEDFSKPLSKEWEWLRENPDTWRLGVDGLEIRIEPGNMWGGSNDAKNVLTYPLPDFSEKRIAVEAAIENHPTSQYEQVDLVCYFNDSNMVKIGLELVHGQLSLVMGREEKDKTKTLCIIPMEHNNIELRIELKGKNIIGYYRTPAIQGWQFAGTCDLPAKGKPKLSIQCYQGPKDEEHWANIRHIKVLEEE